MKINNSSMFSIGRNIEFLLLFCFLLCPKNLNAQIEVPFYASGMLDTFIVPDCVSSITIVARGADGGNSEVETGGEGQTIEATFSVIAGDTLEIVVGEPGLGEGVITSGGGGGSGVRNISSSKLLIIAGGGGGSAGFMNSGIGKGGKTVITDAPTVCGFDSPSCGGSLTIAPSGAGGGGGGGGYIGDGEGDGIFSFGGIGGFGAPGGLGSSISNHGGYGVGGGGGGIVNCAGGGGGGGYIGGKGGSLVEGDDGGGSGGIGFVNNVPFIETIGENGASTNTPGVVQISYSMNTPPTVSANASINNNTLFLDATFLASPSGEPIRNWNWTGPNGFTSNVEDPTINPAIAGTYSVEVTDENGCTTTSSIEVEVPTPEDKVQSIPTLSQWGLILYALLILNLSLWLIRNFQQIPKPVAPSTPPLD